MTKSIAIVGAGLAGTACAYVLKNAGLDPVLYDPNGLASAASGNTHGMYNPRFTAENNEVAEFYSFGFFEALEVFEELSSLRGGTADEAIHSAERDFGLLRYARNDGEFDIGWNPTGALHFINDEKKDKRFHKTARNWDWPKEDMQIVDAKEASEIAGVPIEYDALYLPRSGFASPAKLCAAYADGIELREEALTDLSKPDADVIILACGTGVTKFEEAAHLPLGQVRGQVTMAKATDESANLKTCLCYSGYTSPAVDGQHLIGSTFQRWLSHSYIIEEDDQDNIEKLKTNVPSLAQESFEITDHRASVRCTSKDHFPVIGHVKDNIYIAAAHGSHGMLSSLAGAYLLTSMIKKDKLPLSDETIRALSPARFCDT